MNSLLIEKTSRELSVTTLSQRRLRFEDTMSEFLQTITIIFFSSKWSTLLLRIAKYECVENIFALFLETRMVTYVDDVNSKTSSRIITLWYDNENLECVLARRFLFH